MWTETTDGRQLITDLSKQMVTQVAPEELDLFDELIEEYFDDPSPPDLSESDDDDALGFGLNEVVVAITPAAAAAASSAVGYILTEVLKSAQEESAAVLAKKVRKLFDPKDKTGALTTEQLRQIRRLALSQAKVFGMEAGQARSMADALVGSLALAA
jgi:hypothetical protein